MTLTYINIKNMPEPYGPTAIALTDSQTTGEEGLTKEDVQKLTQKNKILSLGTGVSKTIKEQNRRVRTLEESIDEEYLIKEFFPEMVEYHLSKLELPNLLDPNLNPNELPDPLKEKLYHSQTKTYIVLNKEGKPKIFEFKLSGDIEEGRKGILFYRPKMRIIEGEEIIISGSGRTSLSAREKANNLHKEKVEFINDIELSEEMKNYDPILRSMMIAETASKSGGVNDKFQIGIVNNIGYHPIFNQGVSFDDDDETLEYINLVLSTNIPQSNLIPKLEGKDLADEVADRFYSNFNKLQKASGRLSLLNNKIRWDPARRKDLEKDLKYINEEKFIPDRNMFYSSIENLMKGEIYKILEPESEGRKRIEELQKKYPKKTL